MGVKLRKLRGERHLSQIAMAQALGISPSYLNQLEQNQRPLTVSVLLKINRVFGVDIQAFSEDEEARMIAGLQHALAEAAEPIALAELQEVAAQMPALGRAVLALHRRQLDALERVETLSLKLGDGRSEDIAPAAAPFEAVRDFFFAHQNYFDPLDRSAELLANQAESDGKDLQSWLVLRLAERHGVRVHWSAHASPTKRSFCPRRKVLELTLGLSPSQQAFQLGTQLALLEQGPTIDQLIDTPQFVGDAAARKLARIGLANYFAGALLLPYEQFLKSAESLHYDIELMGQRFHVGFETVCHRLSTLQRPEAPGVPFFFVRVDRAGNISKRQSATHFHFSRTGGTCPLWNVYEAFERPDRILPQIASMPDGRRYLWVARTVSSAQGGFGAARRTFSIGLGCDIRHASRLVYARGLNLTDPMAATPIGMGCKVCEREACAQRAFPYVGRALSIDENHSRIAPYSSSTSAQ